MESDSLEVCNVDDGFDNVVDGMEQLVIWIGCLVMMLWGWLGCSGVAMRRRYD